LLAYVTHFDPDLAFYGESWLDRAHSKPLDVLVMQGALGAIVYVVFLVFIVRAMLQRRGHERVILLAFFGGYVVQNLVLFDQMLSYITLFGLAGYLAGRGGREREEVSLGVIGSKMKGALVAVGAALVLGVGYLGYTQTYTPYRQSGDFIKARRSDNAEDAGRYIRRAYEPYNFFQYTLRGHAVDEYYGAQPELFGEEFANPFTDKLILGIDEIIAREPYDPRDFIRMVEMINVKASSQNELYAISADIAADGLALAPKRQELYYYLSLIQGNQGKAEEAIATAQEAVDLSPRVARARLHLAIAYGLAGEEYFERAEEELGVVENLDSFSGLFPGDFENMVIIYDGIGRKDKVIDLVLKGIRGTPPYVSVSEGYQQQALGYAADARDEGVFVEIAERLMKKAKFAEDARRLIDLARGGEWGEIDTLLRPTSVIEATIIE